MTDRKKAYRIFLQTPFWADLSARVKRKAGRCKRCKGKVLLQAHHKFYREDWFQTQEADLVVLCRKCHAKEHGLCWDERFGPRDLMIHRDDWRFSIILYRVDHLVKRIYRGGVLRERDQRFLDNALVEYPTTPEDSCMNFKVNLVRTINEQMKGTNL